ncbi:MAG: hypothetical protein VXX30_05060 [Planctomycetota bacterium]|nr:hypothetical protein [Planctomycetota bacterium]
MTNRPLTTAVLALTATTLFGAVAPGLAAAPQDGPSSPAAAAMAKLDSISTKPGATTSSFKGTVNLAAIGQPGGGIAVQGTSASQPVLDGAGVLSIIRAGDETSLDYMGYRTDTRQYYLLSMAADPVGIQYFAGTLTGPRTLTLTDPMTQVTAETVFTDTDATSKVRVPPAQAVFMDLTTTFGTKPAGDLLESILSAETTAAPAGASPEERALLSLAGDYTTPRGGRIRARTAGNGRYLVAQDPGGLQFLAWNPQIKMVQMFVVNQGTSPTYLQGPVEADGSMVLTDPFNPNNTVTIAPAADGGISVKRGNRMAEVMKATGSPDAKRD